MSYEIYDVAIAGGGPAGTSAAINLAQQGFRVLLAEQKRFPREKLCGEFISPECIKHFERLGVANEISLAKGAELTETSFYARNGNKVSVPSKWFGDDRASDITDGRVELLWNGPDPATELLDDVFCEGAALIDHDRRVLLVFQ